MDSNCVSSSTLNGNYQLITTSTGKSHSMPKCNELRWAGKWKLQRVYMPKDAQLLPVCWHSVVAV
ncbi:hypothetical protein SCA6_013987 [Theobroma cacao]